MLKTGKRDINPYTTAFKIAGIEEGVGGISISFKIRAKWVIKARGVVHEQGRRNSDPELEVDNIKPITGGERS